MIGFALEGGGSRGSYQIGVVKAYMDNGYEFDGFVGTSIGAINAAILAQGDLDLALDLWSNLSMSQLFDADEELLLEMGNISLDTDFLVNLTKSALRVIKDKGVDTSKMRSIISNHINEDKIRASGKDFGLVTVSINELKPYELYLEDIPKGKLIDYIMASACFPGFKSQIIDDKPFIDGGVYNNCPTNLLIDKGYKDIIIVRTKAPGLYRKFIAPNSNMKEIYTKENLGNVMIFKKERIEENIKYGYCDGLRHVHNLLGENYYIEPDTTIEAFKLFLELDDATIIKVGEVMGFLNLPPKRLLFEKILPHLGSHKKLEKHYDYEDILILILEHAAMEAKLERYKVYSFRDFIKQVQSNLPSSQKSKRRPLLLPTLLKDNDSIAMDLLATAITNMRL